MYHQEVLIRATIPKIAQSKIDSPKDDRPMSLSPTSPLPTHRVIKLEGLHITIHMQGPERLKIKTPKLDEETSRALRFDAEDWHKVVDDVWKFKRTRGGRSWELTGKKIDELTRERIARLEPFPSSFPNTLGKANTYLHDELRQMCWVINRDRNTGWQNNFYILGHSNIPKFMALIEEVNSLIDDLNKRIIEFTKTSDYSEFKFILSKYKLDGLLNKPWHINHASFEASELELEPATLRQTLDKLGQREMAKFDEQQRAEYLRRLAEFDRQVKETQHERVDLVMEDFNKKLNNLVETIARTGRKRSSQSIKEQCARARNLAIDMGLEVVATSIIDPLTIVADHPERAIELFGVDSKELGIEIDGRLKGLMEGI